ncbi:MAG: mechanosensitive ion channel [Gammaproteobacteria bacterium]|nr:mechanosensitive ion channel [Gammaproteobacteria bacterium]
MENLLGALDAQLNSEAIWLLVIHWSGRILAALVIFLIGRWVAKALIGFFVRAAAGAEMDKTLSRFLSNLINIALMILIALTALSALGVNTTNFLAIFGAIGLAVGLALKDSFSNFAAGVMLVFFRPFKSGDFIEAAGISGIVQSISIFNTVLKTPDNRVIIVPNSLIHADTITNHSAEDMRRIDLIIGIGYNDDIARAKALIQGVLSQNDRVLDQPPPSMMLLDLGESSVDIAVRPWTKSANYWSVRSELLENIKRALEHAGLSLPYPQRDLHIVEKALKDLS